MKHYKLSVLTLALASAGLSAYGAAAQEVAKDNKAKPTEQQIEVIGVTGYRGSLQKAQLIKMSENSVVEVLSAEDIGKLPDTSVAESLSRLPGLAGERRNGRTSGLSVRGFNENYVGTSLNGRELLGMGDNRGVEYDLYPSEIVNTVLVYKTPEASLMAQGIGGTVDIQTASPLTASPTMAFNLSYEQNGQDSGNPDFDNSGHRASFNFIDKFADDKLGVALVLSTIESPRQEQQFRGWGYSEAKASQAAPGVTVPAGTVVNGGHDSFTRSALLDRDSLAAVVEYAATDKLKMKFDALLINFNETDARRGLEEGGSGDSIITSVDNGLATSGYYNGFYSVIRNDAREQDASLKTFGFNLEYALNDEWTAEVDISTGDVEKTITDIESYSGVGRASIDGRPIAARSWKMTSTGVMYGAHPTLPSVDYTNAALIRLAGPQAWGGSLAPITAFKDTDGFGPSTAQDGFVNKPEFDESLDSYRFQVTGDVEWGIVNKFEAGIVYKERSKTKINNGAFLTSKLWPNSGAIPDVLGVADLGFIGIPGVLAYDSLALYNSGYYISTDAALLQNDRLGDSYTVDEEIVTLYSMANLSTEVAGLPLEGNVGVQIVDSKQSSKGFYAVTGAGFFTKATRVEGGADYTDVLPSLNLSLEVADDQFVRTGLSKVMTRPRIDDLRPNTTYNFDFNDDKIVRTNPVDGPWNSNEGNAELKPLEANQFDLSYENYYHENGYVAASFFFKDLVNWHRSAASVNDFSAFYIPGFHQTSTGQAPGTLQGVAKYRDDGMEGFVRGYELQASVPFDLVHASLDGLGLVASATFLDGSLGEGSQREAVPGLSNEIYTLTAYYEKAGFEFRVSGTKRDEFSTETRGYSLSLAPTVDQGGTLVDAQIGYDFGESGIKELEGLRVSLQGQNLTDEATIQANSADSRQITQYQSFGRNFMLSMNYKF